MEKKTKFWLAGTSATVNFTKIYLQKQPHVDKDVIDFLSQTATCCQGIDVIGKSRGQNWRVCHSCWLFILCLNMWNNEIQLNFLEFYQRELVLWDPKHPSHKKKQVLHDAWNRISEALHTPIPELKKKKDSLMATYRSHKRKIKSSFVSISCIALFAYRNKGITHILCYRWLEVGQRRCTNPFGLHLT